MALGYILFGGQLQKTSRRLAFSGVRECCRASRAGKVGRIQRKGASHMEEEVDKNEDISG
jgi:hypothetical protein